MKIYACYKSIHYEHLMIVKWGVGVLEIFFLSPWYNDIYLDYACICTLNGMLVFRSYMYYCGSVCITINNINQIIALYNKTIIDFCFRSMQTNILTENKSL